MYIDQSWEILDFIATKSPFVIDFESRDEYDQTVIDYIANIDPTITISEVMKRYKQKFPNFYSKWKMSL